MILIASLWSLTAPMCQPPRQRIETLTPVLPSGRVGSPPDPFSSAPAVARAPSAAPAATDVVRNSRRVLVGSFIAALLGLTVQSSPPVDCRLPWGGCQQNPAPCVR